MTVAIAFGVEPHAKPRLERPPLGHCFTVWLDPAFSDEERVLIGEGLVAMIGLTNGDVGFQVTPDETAAIRIVKDGARPIGIAYAGLAYRHVSNYVILGGEIVLHPDWVAHKVVRHEIAHLLGMEHPQQRGSLMSDLPHDSQEIPDVDRVAWRYMAELEPGTLRPGLEGAAAARHQRPYVLVD